MKHFNPVQARGFHSLTFVQHSMLTIFASLNISITPDSYRGLFPILLRTIGQNLTLKHCNIETL